MELKPGEIIGAILAFIPGVSTISGAIQAFIYYHRTEQGSAKQKQMEDTANKIQTTIDDKIKSHAREKIHKSNNELWKASILEMIPGVNIIAAIYSVIILNKISQARESEKDPDSYIIRKYDLNEYDADRLKHSWINSCTGGFFDDSGIKPEVRKIVIDALKIIENLSIPEEDRSWLIRELQFDSSRYLFNNIDPKTGKVTAEETGKKERTGINSGFELVKSIIDLYKTSNQIGKGLSWFVQNNEKMEKMQQRIEIYNDWEQQLKKLEKNERNI